MTTCWTAGTGESDRGQTMRIAGFDGAVTLGRVAFLEAGGSGIAIQGKVAGRGVSGGVGRVGGSCGGWVHGIDLRNVELRCTWRDCGREVGGRLLAGI